MLFIDYVMPEIEVTDELVDELRGLIEMDEDNLYTILGYQSLGLEEKPTELQLFGGFSITESELMMRGKSVFSRNQQRLKEKICEDWEYCKKKGIYKEDFGLLMDALVPFVTIGLNLPAPMIVVLCVLAFKYGLNRLCECGA